MRWMISMLMVLTLSGCNLDISELTTGSAATATGVLGTALGGPTVGVVAGLGTTALVDSITVEELDPIEAISQLPPEEQAAALKMQFFWSTIESLGYYAILAVLAFFLIPLVIGYLMPNRRQRKLEKIAFDNPDIKSDHL